MEFQHFTGDLLHHVAGLYKSIPEDGIQNGNTQAEGSRMPWSVKAQLYLHDGVYLME
jgi:hypothetical protein